MKEKKNKRVKWLSVRLSGEEEEKLLHLYRQTTARGLSEYARDVLLKAPVTVRYRNASADAFLQEMIGLKNELATIGTNMRLALHQLQEQKDWPQLHAWLVLNEAHQQALEKKTAEILDKAHQIYRLWWQK